MRTAILSGLIVSLLVACQSTGVGPTGLLYKTWERQPVTSSTNTDQLLTFRADGQVRYGTNQDEAGCCRPGQFKLANDQLVFIISYGKIDCSLVYCVQSPLVTSTPWTVTTLTESDLTIRNNGQSITFKAR
ncbi:hypothetical protein ACAW74_23270 [Fibrella sp. WM1]|uniref:hypothetical protein n=1 Tax=Fibrella musci TaxID=3242485 RepID=UPI0035222CAF